MTFLTDDENTATDLPAGWSAQLAGLSQLMAGTELVAERCRHEIAMGGNARDTLDYLMERIGAVKEAFRALTPVEQDALWLDLVALLQEARELRASVVQHGQGPTLRPRAA
ncbi:MAG: hypothetical protein JNL21_00805 [Myxococcales bacterium]|nr:hypothetical protein [Myxococcales bacterium]